MPRFLYTSLLVLVTIAPLAAQTEPWGKAFKADLVAAGMGGGTSVTTCTGINSQPVTLAIDASFGPVSSLPVSVGGLRSRTQLIADPLPSRWEGGELTARMFHEVGNGLPLGCGVQFRSEYVLTVQTTGALAGQAQPGYLRMRADSILPAGFGMGIQTSYSVDVFNDGTPEFVGVNTAGVLMMPVVAPPAGLTVRVELVTTVSSQVSIAWFQRLESWLAVDFSRVQITPTLADDSCILRREVEVTPSLASGGRWDLTIDTECLRCSNPGGLRLAFVDFPPALPVPGILPIAPFCSVGVSAAAVATPLDANGQVRVRVPAQLMPLQGVLQIAAFDPLGVWTSPPYRFGVVL